MKKAKDITVPFLGDSISEATVAKWLKFEGEVVQEDEPLVELETDKVTLEVNAPLRGILARCFVKTGETVSIGQVLGNVTEAGSKAGFKKNTPEEVQKTPVELPPSAEKEITRVPMNRVRQRIAERLKEAQNTAAILTTFNEVDMSRILALRSALKETFEKKHEVKLGFMSFFVKACLLGLKELPALNAEIEGTDVLYKNYYDIGVAVGTDQGLVVPVIRAVDQKSFAQIEKDIADLSCKAREATLSPKDLQGGTFTLSNGGVYGSLLSTPILNPPQSGILGMHKIQERPIAIEGRVEIRPMMYLALSYDHRLIDGKEAVTFLVRVKESLENPERLLLDI